jgi:hypothetical protein
MSTLRPSLAGFNSRSADPTIDFRASKWDEHLQDMRIGAQLSSATL